VSLDLGPRPWTFFLDERPPAPGRLRLVQALVNTVNLETGKDVIDTPAGLVAWLEEFDLLPADAPVLDSDVARARELREALRLLVRKNAEPDLDATAAAQTVSRVAATGRLTVDLRRIRPPPSARSRDRRVAVGRGGVCVRGHGERDVDAASGLSAVPLGELRPLPEPLVAVVLHALLRQPHQDARLPAAEGRRVLAARIRPARAPLRVAWARIRARPGRGVLVAAGVALATAAAAGIAGGGIITADLELHRSLAALPPADRSISATWLGAPPAGGYGEIDRTATAALSGIEPAAPAAPSPTRSST
jgi:hypothetical protein